MADQILDPQPANLAPTAESERLEVMDALRGFALLGVLIVNLRDLSLFELLPEAARAALPTARWDHFLEIGMAALVDAKAMTVFTILFGVGFALQMQRAKETKRRTMVYVRRLCVLLLIGLLHAFFWWGDILVLYALMGLLLVPLAGRQARTLALIGMAVALFSSPLLRPVMNELLPKIASSKDASASALTAFSANQWDTMLSTNASHFVWSRISAWGLPFFTLGRLLLGVALGYAGVLRNPETRQRFWRRLTWAALSAGILLTAFVMLRDHGVIGAGSVWWKAEPGRSLVRIARSGGSLFLGLGYVGLFVLLFQRVRWRRWLHYFSPIGRMALTNYLAQTVLGIALFYGVGFGIGPRFGLAGVLLAGAIIFSAQLWLSRWWLVRFRFGPVEWIWRCLTYGRRFSLRRSASA